MIPDWIAICQAACLSELGSSLPSISRTERRVSPNAFDMTTTSKPVPSVIRPGKAPEGPPGWEERRVEKQVQAEQAQEERNYQRENSTGLAGIKEKVHKIGEKMHLVEPKDPAQRSAAQLQVSHNLLRRSCLVHKLLIQLLLLLAAHCPWYRTLRPCRNRPQLTSNQPETCL